jgi:uncharacterized protein
MQGDKKAAVGLVGLALLWIPVASAASFDCSSRWLSRTEMAICNDTQLSRVDEAVARRLRGFARRLNFGQYLGLRHWHAASARQRNQCGTDRICIAASYRAQARFLDRLQHCLEASFSRRACLRDLLVGDRETMRR